jgi:hygromycin-B 4-O-kinase
MSQAFSFQTNEGSFVIRVNIHSTSFHKDKYAFEHFATKEIPIPEIIQIGKLDDVYSFAISKKAEGKHINDLTEDEYNITLPDLLRVMDAIHAVDIRNSLGYGKWNLEGNGEFSTWKDFIIAVNRFPDKENLFETSFLEKETWQRIYSQIEKLSEFCSDEKYLVHGDYGNSNVRSDGMKITGVFDWEHSCYGDPLYDIAWLTFWQKKPFRIKEIEDYYRARNMPHFDERLLCYKLRIGLSSLSFYAYSQQRDKYDSIKQRIFDLL